MKKTSILSILVFGLLWCGGLITSEVKAATRTVDNTSDNGALTACTAAPNDCSLRGAVSSGSNFDTVNFDPSLNGSTITLGSLISIPHSVTIAGPGADQLTISGGNTTSLFQAIGSSISITFSGLTFANGNGAGGSNDGQGGAIEINSVTSATFDRVVFRNNSAPILGGALLCFAGTCRISNSTFTNNSSPQASVLYEGFGTNEITNTTITGNTETASAFGALYLRGTTIIRNSTIANNSGRSNIYVSTENITLTLGNTILAGSAGTDIFANGGTINTNGGNIIGRNGNAGATFASTGLPNANGDFVGANLGAVDPHLAPLGNYGGPTPTRALLQNSLALNHGINCVVNNTCSPATSGALTTDQRGAPRLIGAFVDIGAVESNFTFDQNSLPNGNRNALYDQQLTVTRQNSFALTKGTVVNLVPLLFETIPPSGATGLPPGLTLETGGELHGVPTLEGGYTFFVKVTDQADGMAGVVQYTVAIGSPTAATASIAGRVLTSDGSGLRNARVILTDASGNSRVAISGSFGYYRFDQVESGQTYVVSVASKNFQFAPQVVGVEGEIGELDFIAQP